MQQIFRQILKLLEKKEVLFCGLLISAFVVGRAWKLDRVGVIHNSGHIEKLTVKMDEVTNGEWHSTSEGELATAISDQALRQNSISVNFTYLNASEDIPQLDPEQLLITARNPITRIYNKVARLNQLQRELEEEPSLPLIQSRPTSMRLECPSVVPEKDALRRLEENLDRDLTRLEQLLAHNTDNNKIAFAEADLSFSRGNFHVY